MKRPTVAERVRGLLHRLIRTTHGQDLIEYALLAAIVTVGAVVVVNQIGETVAGKMADTATEVHAGIPAGSGGGAGDGGDGGDGGGAGDGGGDTTGADTGGGTGRGGGTGGGGTGGGGRGGK